MPQTVEIEGVGKAEFPDEFTPDQISAIIKRDYGDKETKVSALGAGLRAGAKAVGPTAAAMAAFEPGAAVGAEIGAPGGPIGIAAGGLIGGGITSTIAAIGATWGQKKLVGAVLPEHVKKHLDDLEQADIVQQPTARRVGELAAMLPSAEFAPGRTLYGLAQLPKLLRGAPMREFDRAAAQTAIKQIGAQTALTTGQSLAEEQKLPSLGDVGESVVAATLFGEGRFKSLPKATAAAAAAITRTGMSRFEVKGKNASEILEAAKIHGDVRTQQEPTGPLPQQKSGAGVQPQAKAGVAKEAQIPLGEKGARFAKVTGDKNVGFTVRWQGQSESGFKTMEEAMEAADAMENKERKIKPDKVQPTPKAAAKPAEPAPAQAEMSMEVPDEVIKAHEEAAKEAQDTEDQVESEGGKVGLTTRFEDKPLEGDQPFSGRIASVNPNGEMVVNRQELHEFTDQVPKEQKDDLIQSLVGEEHIHSLTTDEDARDFWDNSSWLEKRLATFRYTGNLRGNRIDRTGKVVGRFSDLNLAHEALRGHLQMLQHMTPREVADVAGHQQWSQKIVYWLENFIRKIRARLGTKASKVQQGILDKMTRNLELAKDLTTPIDPEAFAKEIGFNFKENKAAGVGLEGLTPEQRAQMEKLQPTMWEFTNPASPHDDPMGAVSFYVPKDSNWATTMRTYIAKRKAFGIGEEPEAYKRKVKETEDERLSRRVREAMANERAVKRRHAEGYAVNAWEADDARQATVQAWKEALDHKYGAPEAYQRRPAEELRELVDQTQREAGWDPKWPFIPADFYNKSFRDAIESDPNLSKPEKDRMFSAASKLLGGEIGRTGQPEAYRRRKKGETDTKQGVFFMPPSADKWVGAKEASQAPPLKGEEKDQLPLLDERRVGAVESGALPSISARDIEAAARYHLRDLLREGNLSKTFETFHDWVTRNVGPVDEAKLRQTYEAAVHRVLKAATPEMLAKGLADLDIKVGGRRGGFDIATGVHRAPREMSRMAEAGEGVEAVGGLQDPTFTLGADVPQAFKTEVSDRPNAPAFSLEAESTGYKGQRERAAEKQRKAEFYQEALERRKESYRKSLQAVKNRTAAVARIADALLKQAEPPKGLIDPRHVTMDDIDFENDRTVHGAVRNIGPDEWNNPDAITNIIKDRARGSKEDPVSHSHRLLALKNKSTGAIELVSAYPYEDGARVADPANVGVTERPFRDIKTLLDRYVPIQSVLVKPLLKGFHEHFESESQYMDRFGREGARRSEVARESVAGLEEEEPYNVQEYEGRRTYEGPFGEVEMGRQSDLPAEERSPEGTPRPSSVIEGEGGSVTGQEAEEGRELMGGGAEGELSKIYRVPLTDREAGAVREFVLGTVGKVDDPQDMKDALEELVGRVQMATRKPDVGQEERIKVSEKKPKEEFAGRVITAPAEGPAEVGKPVTRVTQQGFEVKGRLKTRDILAKPMPGAPRGIYRQVISGIAKAAHRFAETHPDFTPDQAYDAALTTIYEHLKETEGQESLTDDQKQAYFIQRALGSFTEPAEKPRTSISQLLSAPERERIERARLGGARELSMRERRAPTSVAGLPPGLAPERPEASPGVVRPPEALTPRQQTSLQRAALYRSLRGEPKTPEHPGGPEGPSVPREDPWQKLVEVSRPVNPEAEAERENYRKVLAASKAVKASEFLPGMGAEAYNRNQNRLEETWGRMKSVLGASWPRHLVKEQVQTERDATENLFKVVARNAGNYIRLVSSVDTGGKPRPLLGVGKWLGKFPAFKAEYAREVNEAQVRKSALAVLATGELQKETEEAMKAAGRTKPKTFWVSNHHKIAELIAMTDSAIADAKFTMSKSDPWSRWMGRKWLAAAQELKDAAIWADKNWTNARLRQTTTAARAEFQRQWFAERKEGFKIKNDYNYAPGRYDPELWNDSKVIFDKWGVMGRNFRAPGVFNNYYEAIKAGPYIAKNLDIADLVEHRVRQGGLLIAKNQWLRKLEGMKDPPSGDPLVMPVEVKQEPMFNEKGEPILTEGGKQQMKVSFLGTNPNYEVVSISKNSPPLQVRKGYQYAISSAAGQSALREIPVTREVLRFGQWLKHNGILIYDFYHPSRLSQYAFSLSGFKNPIETAFGRRGAAALNYREGDLKAALDKGLLRQEDVDWATKEVPIKFGDQEIMLSPMAGKEWALRNGLNVARLQDALYGEVKNLWPGLGNVNKAIFDVQTRGQMMEAVWNNFVKLNKANPDIAPDTLMRDVVKDTNIFYGSLGRQGILKSPTLRDFAQMIMLAPGWVEGLAQKETRFYSRLTGLSTLTGRQGPYLGALGGAMAKGLLFWFGLTQAMNIISRGKTTFQNDEEGHKLDAYVNFNGHGFWISPMSVFAELSHDVLRLFETKPTVWDVADQIGRNKLGPWGRMGIVLATKQNAQGEFLPSTAERVKATAGTLLPVPITVGQLGRFFANRAAPEAVAPPRPGGIERQFMATFGGIKAEQADTPMQRITRIAQRWQRANGQQPSMEMVATTAPSYSKMRSFLRAGDMRSAGLMLDDLRKSHTDEQILHAMTIWSRSPLTGSQSREINFLYSLSNEQRELYSRAQEQRLNELQLFYNLWQSHPARP